MAIGMLFSQAECLRRTSVGMERGSKWMSSEKEDYNFV